MIESAGLRIPTLETANLRLEALSPAHSAGMFALWSDARVCEHSGSAVDTRGVSIELPAATSGESDRLLRFWTDRAERGSGFRFAVLQSATSEFLGAIGFNSLGACSEFAFHLIPRFWGCGYASEASRMALSWVFSEGADSVEAFASPTNERSLALLTRLGFTRSERLREGALRYHLSRVSELT